jgi:hypothetical protein
VSTSRPKYQRWNVFRGISFQICVPISKSSPRFVLVSLQSRSEAAGGDAWRHDAAGGRAAIGTDQAMEPILVHERFEHRQFGDLVDQRFGVVTR